MKTILEKSGKFVRGKKWEPCNQYWSFLVIHKVGNVDIFVFSEFEKYDR